MAVLKQRLHRKNSSGTYDIVYLENIATNVKMSDTDSTTVATAIAGKAASSHTHSAASTSVNGFMTSAMVTKLNGIATGANKTTVDTVMSSTSTNPVQNKVVNSALAGKSSTSHTHTNMLKLSSWDASTATLKITT